MEHALQSNTAALAMPPLLLAGLLTLVSFYVGRAMKWVRLPSIIGFMLVGVLCGPSGINLLDAQIQTRLSFITEIALGLVAFSIGLELSINSLRSQGRGIIAIILAESFAAFGLVTVGIYLLTDNLALAVVFGALAPASAPAGTVAVIKEYRAQGSLTRALYAVVGFDDGLAIIIFGFAAAFARTLIDVGGVDSQISLLGAMLEPLKEIVLSLLVGACATMLFRPLIKKARSPAEVLILIVALVLMTNGLCTVFHLSLILTNMVIGLGAVNTLPRDIISKVEDQLTNVMPLFFVLFFSLAGAHLNVSALPSLGWIGVVYIICRSVGLVGGSRVGGSFGSVEAKVKKYVGMGILSQAGVAIGLALIVNQEFRGLGAVVGTVDGLQVTSGDVIATAAITTITATSIFFEIIGPILTKIALERAGEIDAASR